MIVRIKSKRDGYRRCGIVHPRLATDHPAERFTEGMLAKLKADPVLSVELLDGEAPGAAPLGGGQTGDSEPVGDGGATGTATSAAPAKPVKPAAAKPRAGGGSAKPAAKKATKPAAKPKAPTKPADKPAAKDDQAIEQQPASDQGEQPGEQQGGEA